MDLWHTLGRKTGERLITNFNLEFDFMHRHTGFVASGANYLLDSHHNRVSYCPTIDSHLTYHINEDDTTTLMTRAKESLMHLSEDIKRVKMELKRTNLPVRDLIDALASTAHPNLKYEEISGGTLRDYNDDEAANDELLCLRLYQLKFETTRMDDRCLSSLLTNSFSEIKSSVFNNCQMSGSNDDDDHREGGVILNTSDVCISMPETIVAQYIFLVVKSLNIQCY